jgi:glycosyltransferase involved in cell wall biosynthesis
MSLRNANLRNLRVRVLVIQAPEDLSRNLQLRANSIQGLELMVAAKTNPLLPGTGATTFFPYISRRKIDLQGIRAIRKAIRTFQPDVVHSFLPRPLAQTVLACVGLKHRPKIVSFYGITRVPSWSDPSNWITYLSSRVAMHACESNAVKQALVAGGVSEQKCEVVYNCVGKAASTQSRHEIRTQFNIPTDAFVIGTVATMRPVKGIDILMQALIQCHELPNVFALLAGPVDDPVVAKLASDPRISDRVRLLGYTPNASALMHAMDLFVMPSRKEGLCRALLEAMEQGLCPVVSDAGGMKEIVRNGIDGVVFPSEDVQALEIAIRQLFESPSLIQQYGASSLARVQAMCSPEVVGERVLQMYQRLAS